jgi:carbonic anhydrase
MEKKIFVTSINCMDGRVILPLNNYMRNRYGAEYVDTITAGGPIRFLAGDDSNCIKHHIMSRIGISVNLHGSNVVAISGHYDCAGNPKSKEEQIEQIKISVDYVKNVYPDVEILALWVNEHWEVEEIAI